MYTIGMKEKIYQLALARCDGIGPKRFHQLMTEFPSATDVFSASESELKIKFKIPSDVVHILHNPKLLDVASKEWELAQSHQIRFLFYFENEFPPSLRQSHFCPSLISLKGQLPSTPISAVVGTRQATSEGIQYCTKIAEYLKNQNRAMISGLALGIDRAAHRASLDLGIPNLAVLGQGLLPTLDSQATIICEHILAQGGGIISQFGLWAPAERHNFPIRNGIIAGMAHDLYLVESQIKGGAMITARMTLKDQRPLYAWAGHTEHLVKKGPQHLLHQGLALDLEATIGGTNHTLSPPNPHFSSLQHSFLSFIQSAKNIEEIQAQLQLSISQILTLITEMELQGWIDVLPGRTYLSKVNV